VTNSHAFARFVAIAATVVALSACANSRNPNTASDASTPSLPSTPGPGLYNMTVSQAPRDKGGASKPPGAYSGPATFSDSQGGTSIVLWTDSTFTTRLVELFRQAPVTAPVICTLLSLSQSARKVVAIQTSFLVTDTFTAATANLSGEIDITALSDATLTATMNYHDDAATVNTVAASFNAVRR